MVHKTESSPSSAARRKRLGWGLSGIVTVVWAIVVLSLGLGSRVAANWEATVTMLFGSVLAGSSPEGGGAVAFPVFTKAMQVPGPVARTFGLSIQAVGMTMATISILLSGRVFHRRAAVVGSAAAVVSFGLAVALFGRSDVLFWPSRIGTPWVKASFSIVLATTSILMLRHLRAHRRQGDRLHTSTVWNERLDVGLVIAAAVGGFLSSLTGTGANILVFLFLVVVADVAPKSALPTAIMVMTSVSIVGFVLFGIIDGQLDVSVVGDRVVAVGSNPADLDAGRADLLGLWLAAVPVVVWGAPLGSWAASLVQERHLVRFVAALAAIEVVTTVILVPELRTEPALMLYLMVGLALLPLVFVTLERRRADVFAMQTRTTTTSSTS